MNTNGRMGLAARVVLMVGMLTVWGATSPGQPPAGRPAAWEYTYMNGGNGDNREGLNKLGAQGWEMVSAYQTDPLRSVVYVFKRAKQ
jgi:hypothetical protein